MLVVSNTSPISNLAIVGRLEFLQSRYSVVHIPSAVVDELSALKHPPATRLIQSAIAAVERVENTSFRPLPFPLDPGETAAIVLACQLKADVLLLDEKRGREAALLCGAVVVGVLGELIHAKLAGWIPNVRDEIRRLRSEVDFFVDATVEEFILPQVGE